MNSETRSMCTAVHLVTTTLSRIQYADTRASNSIGRDHGVSRGNLLIFL